MTNAAITKELEELRAQVAELTRVREGKAPEQQTEAVGASVQAAVNTPQKRSVDVSEEDEGNEDDLSLQIQDYYCYTFEQNYQLRLEFQKHLELFRHLQ